MKKNLLKMSTLMVLLVLAVCIQAFAQISPVTSKEPTSVTYSPASVLLNESFDGATFPPAGWQNIQLTGIGLWNRTTAGIHPVCSPHTGAGMAFYNDYNFGSDVSAMLVSPALTLPAGLAKNLNFWMYRDDGWPAYPDSMAVYYNTAPDLSGAIFLGQVFRYNPISGWFEFNYAIPVAVSGSYYIIFKANSNYGNDMFVDDIVISALQANDVGITSILSPDAMVSPGAIVPQVIIKNFGTQTQTNIPVSYKIGTTGQVVTQTVASLDPAATANVVFPVWTAVPGGPYNFIFYTALTGDADNSNDTLTRPVNCADLLLNESFDGTIFPPTGWQNIQFSGTGLWDRTTAGVYPACSPHSGAGMAYYNDYNFGSGVSAMLISPAVNFVAGESRNLNFWMHRDDGWPAYQDSMAVYCNTAPDLTGAIFLGKVFRVNPISGWFEFNYTIPSSFAGSYYIIFKANSNYGNDMFVDDIILSTQQLPEHDLAATLVTGISEPIINAPADYTVTVVNMGLTPELGSNYNVQLFDANDLQIGVASGIDIGALGTQDFTFTWTPQVEGATYIYGKVMLTGDLNPANDSTPNLPVTVMPTGAVNVQIGTMLETSFYTPINNWYSYSFSQVLYLQSELNIANKQIFRIGYQYAGSNPNLDNIVEVYLSHSSATELTASVPLTNFIKVYDGPWVCHAGDDFSYIDIQPFYYNNIDNLIITIIEKKPGYNSWADAYKVTPTEIDQHISISAQNDVAFDPNNLPAGNQLYLRPNTMLVLSDVSTNPVSNTSPDTLDFGQVEATLSSVMNVTVMNSGGGILEITGSNITDNHYSILNASYPINLGVGESHIFEVQFAPTDVGLVEAVLTFLMDDSIAGTKSSQLSGTGLHFGALRESFEGELFPPLGWKIVDHNYDTKEWYRNVIDAPTGQTVPHTGIAAAGLDAYAGSNTGQLSYNDWLITPKMIWQDNDVFQFFIKRLADFNGQKWRVCLSTTGNEVADFVPFDEILDPPLTYIEKSYDLSAQGLNNGDNFYIGIEFSSPWCWPGVIDDVLGSVKASFDNDLMALSFTGNDIIYKDSTNNYSAVIGNSGINPVTDGDYVVQVCAVVNGVETVFATANGLAIAPGENVLVSIPVNISVTGVYGLYSKIVWSDDINPANNMSEALSVEVISNSIVVKNIGDYPITTQTPYTEFYPLDFWDIRGASLHECLYFTNELNTGGIINRLSYYKTFGTSLPSRRVKVYMVETDTPDFDLGAIPASQMSLVFDGNIDFETGPGRVNIDLTNPFVYTGSGNLAVMVYYFLGGAPYIVNNALFASQYASGPSRNGFDQWFTTVDPEDLSHMVYISDFPVTSLMFETGNGLGNLTGKVLYDANSLPVEGAKVVIENADFPDTKAIIYTNATGDYVAPYCMAGNNIKVTISKYGFLDVVYDSVSLANGGSVNLGIAYLLPRPKIALTGNVIKSDTEGAAQNAIVKLFGIDNYETTTDINGVFEFGEIWGVTTYQIEVSLDGYQTYQDEIEVPDTNYLLDTITILENAPPPHLVNVVESNGNALVTWYAAGDPYPMQFRYDDGIAVAMLITPGNPSFVGGSAWRYNAIVSGVQWYSGQISGYPSSPQIMITILGLNDDGSPNPGDVLFIQENVTNNYGWNSFTLPQAVNAPNGFFFGISGYSNYTVIAHDDGVDEPYIWQPHTQWSNGMGSYNPFENITSPPLHGNILIRASGLIFCQLDKDFANANANYLIAIPEGKTPLLCQSVEPLNAGDPDITLYYNSGKSSKSFLNYNVFRKLITEDIWQQINSGPEADTSYVDTEWANLASGIYKYAVEAEYTNGVKSLLAESNTIEKLYISVDESDAALLQVFPNPASGLVNIKSTVMIKNFSVLNNTGQNIMTKDVKAFQYTIDMTNSGCGIYLIKVSTTAGQITRKIIIMR